MTATNRRKVLCTSTTAVLSCLLWLSLPSTARAQDDVCRDECRGSCVRNEPQGNAYGLLDRCEATCEDACSISNEVPEFFEAVKRNFDLPGDLTSRTTYQGMIACAASACVCSGAEDCFKLILGCDDIDGHPAVISCLYDEAGLPRECSCVWL
jgi:hypothetical protein